MNTKNPVEDSIKAIRLPYDLVPTLKWQEKMFKGRMSLRPRKSVKRNDSLRPQSATKRVAEIKN